MTLDALMENCRAVYQSRLGEKARQEAETLSGQGGRNARRYVSLKGHRGKGFGTKSHTGNNNASADIRMQGV